jgi:hypothetical protein
MSAVADFRNPEGGWKASGRLLLNHYEIVVIDNFVWAVD